MMTRDPDPIQTKDKQDIVIRVRISNTPEWLFSEGGTSTTPTTPITPITDINTEDPINDTHAEI